MKKQLFYLLVWIALPMVAQTGIGTTTPHASAKLEVASSTQGFLPPRVALTAANQASPVTSPATGLLVFNTQTAGTAPNNVTPGYYYWNGSLWARLIGPSDNSTNVTGVVAVANGGTGATTATGNGITVLSNNPTLELVTIASGSSQFPSSIDVLPSTHASSKRAALWLGRWGILQDHFGDGQQNFSILQHDSGLYPSRFFIDTLGKIGLGTVTPSDSLHIENGNTFGPDPGNTTSPSLYIYNNNNASTTAHSSLAIRTNGNGGGNPYLSFDIGGVRGYSMGIDNADGDKFKFYTNWNLNNSVAPAFTVTTDNRVGIGTTSPASRLHINSSDSTTLYIESTTSDNNGLVILNANTGSNWNVNHHEFMMFQRQGSSIGFIGAVANSNSINYSTTSDYRLKTDLQDYSGLNLVNKIKTYDYAWKSNNYRMHGVMAHELQEVVPYAVSGEKDAIDKAGKILPQAVDYSKLTPILVKAIQEQDLQIKEQHKQIEALIQRMEQLEAKKE